MPKSLKLSDLYVLGKELEVTSPQGSVTVWLQKMNPIDHETALRRANARRANVLSIARFSEEEEDPVKKELRDSYMNELFDLAPNRGAIIDFLATDAVAKTYAAREAEMAAEDEWSEEDYLQGLKDLWNDEMAERFVLDPDDAEATRVHDEIQRFHDALNAAVMSEREVNHREFETWTDEKLVREATNRLIEAAADMQWLHEYRKCEIWKGVRDAKSKKPYFSSRAEVDELSTEILGQLIQGYTTLNVDSTEGKD